VAVAGEVDEDVAPLAGCRWEPEGLLLVTVTVFDGNEAEVQAYYEFSEDGSDAVEGLGDKAHYSEVTKSLEVLVDDNTDITVQVVNAELDEKQAAIDLAEKVIDRLP
jgi:hypothetical protein